MRGLVVAVNMSILSLNEKKYCISLAEWLLHTISLIDCYYYLCNDYMDRRHVNFQMSITSQESELLIHSNGLNSIQISNMMPCFQPIKKRYLCFVIFCLQFSMIVIARCIEVLHLTCFSHLV